MIEWIARNTAVVRWVEQHQIEVFALHRGEEVALADVDDDVVEQCIHPRTAHGGRVDIDGRYRTAAPGGGHTGDA